MDSLFCIPNVYYTVWGKQLLDSLLQALHCILLRSYCTVWQATVVKESKNRTVSCRYCVLYDWFEAEKCILVRHMYFSWLSLLCVSSNVCPYVRHSTAKNKSSGWLSHSSSLKCRDHPVGVCVCDCRITRNDSHCLRHYSTCCQHRQLQGGNCKMASSLANYMRKSKGIKREWMASSNSSPLRTFH